MKDRVPVYPGRVKLVPVSGLANTYDMTRADSATQEGTSLNKANLLSDDTEKLIFGSSQNKTPNEALAELTNRATRPNLLDNWCFLPGYVVNQRGATDLTAGYYGIDRWRNYTGRTAPCSVEADGIHLSCDGEKTQGHQQRLLSNQLIVGKQYTLSALVKVVSDGYEGTNRNVALSYGATFDGISSSKFLPNAEAPIGEWTCASYTFEALEAEDVTSNVRIRTSSSAATEIVVAAMKLELGDTQTLAHQDAEGNWVLNEYPDYNEQLLRCCMSTADPDDTYANNNKTPEAIGAMADEGLLRRSIVGSTSSYVSGWYKVGEIDMNGSYLSYSALLAVTLPTNAGDSCGILAIDLRTVADAAQNLNCSSLRWITPLRNKHATFALDWSDTTAVLYVKIDTSYCTYNLRVLHEYPTNAGYMQLIRNIGSSSDVIYATEITQSLTSVEASPRRVTGTYTGTGVIGTAQSITVGFEPSAVFVLRSDGTVGFGMCIKSGDNQGKLTSAKMSSATNAYTVFNNYIEITSTGFSVLKYHSSYENSLNEADVVYTYIAIG